jgi:ferric-dicitrate binding protein FerR (iron transport regulator)
METVRVTDRMADEAITWFARLRADDVTEADRQGFVSWLRDHRLHQHAFIEILNLWEDLSVLKSLEFDGLQSVDMLWKQKEIVRTRLSNVVG